MLGSSTATIRGVSSGVFGSFTDIQDLAIIATDAGTHSLLYGDFSLKSPSAPTASADLTSYGLPVAVTAGQDFVWVATANMKVVKFTGFPTPTLQQSTSGTSDLPGIPVAMEGERFRVSSGGLPVEFTFLVVATKSPSRLVSYRFGELDSSKTLMFTKEFEGEPVALRVAACSSSSGANSTEAFVATKSPNRVYRFNMSVGGLTPITYQSLDTTTTKRVPIDLAIGSGGGCALGGPDTPPPGTGTGMVHVLVQVL